MSFKFAIMTFTKLRKLEAKKPSFRFIHFSLVFFNLKFSLRYVLYKRNTLVRTERRRGIDGARRRWEKA